MPEKDIAKSVAGTGIALAGLAAPPLVAQEYGWVAGALAFVFVTLPAEVVAALLISESV